MADRYIELIIELQSDLKRELTLDELQAVKWMVAKEFAHLKPESSSETAPIKAIAI